MNSQTKPYNRNKLKKKKNKIEKQNNNNKKALQVKGKVRGDQYKTYAHYSGVESLNEKKHLTAKTCSLM